MRQIKFAIKKHGFLSIALINLELIFLHKVEYHSLIYINVKQLKIEEN